MKLPFDVEEETQPEKQQETITYVRTKTKRTNHPGRMALPSHLPVVPPGKMSNFLAEDFGAVLEFMDAENQKKKLT